MCTLIAWHRAYAGLPLLVAANRDESYGRPARPPALRIVGPRTILSPVDLESNGTWIGLNDVGLFVAITNRFGTPKYPERSSRGQVVMRALGATSVDDCRERLADLDASKERGFHLFVADRQSAHLWISDGLTVRAQVVEPGLHVISERSFDAAPTRRETFIRAALAKEVPHRRQDEAPTDAELVDVLAHHSTEPFESVCVHMPSHNYGTRSSTIVRLGARTSTMLHADGPPCTAPFAVVSRERDECYRCHKAKIVCVCDTVTPVENKTRVIILQHRRERFHPLGTVRLAKLGLANSDVMIFDAADPKGAQRMLPDGTALLFRGPGARKLEDLTPAERPKTLLVIDGTWAQARGLYRHNPWLSELPCFDLAPKVPGQYRIRKEPEAMALSTIEAIIQSLQILEPETPGLDNVLGAFTRMIDQQIEYVRTREGPPRRRKPRPRISHALDGLKAAADRLVLGYGEFLPPPEGPGTGDYQLVYWCAQRQRTGERFSIYVRPPAWPVEGDAAAWERVRSNMRHMGLEERDVAAGVSGAEFESAWRAFMKPGEVLTCWNRSTHDMLATAGGTVGDALTIKDGYCNSRSRTSGPLVDVLTREGLTAKPSQFAGRAGLVVGRLQAVVERLLSEV